MDCTANDGIFGCIDLTTSQYSKSVYYLNRFWLENPQQILSCIFTRTELNIKTLTTANFLDFDQCRFQPSIQMKEYYLDGLKKATNVYSELVVSTLLLLFCLSIKTTIKQVTCCCALGATFFVIKSCVLINKHFSNNKLEYRKLQNLLNFVLFIVLFL